MGTVQETLLRPSKREPLRHRICLSLSSYYRTELTVEGKVPECYAPTRTSNNQSLPAALFNYCAPLQLVGKFPRHHLENLSVVTIIIDQECDRLLAVEATVGQK